MQGLRLAGVAVDVVAEAEDAEAEDAEAAEAADVVGCPSAAGGCFVILFLFSNFFASFESGRCNFFASFESGCSDFFAFFEGGRCIAMPQGR